MNAFARAATIALVTAWLAACGSDTQSGTPGAGGDAAVAGAGGGAGVSFGGTGGSGGSGATAGSTGSAGVGADASAGAAGQAGMGGQAGADAGICGPNVPFAAPQQCATCVNANCCAQKSTCGANAECVALRQCGGKPGCSSGVCWQQCRKDHATGVADNEVFSTCLSKNCNAECIQDPSSACGFQIAPDPACNTCIASACCSEIYDAGQEPEFWDLLTCWQNCGTDTNCQIACSAQYPLGYQKNDTLYNCEATSCSSLCTFLATP
jgi:hypothetical protein